MKKTFALLITAILCIQAAASDASGELRTLLKKSDEFTENQKNVLSGVVRASGGNRAFSVAIIDNQCVGAAAAMIAPSGRMTPEMILRSTTGQLQLRVYAEVIREKGMPAQVLKLLPLTDARRQSLLAANWTSLVKFDIAPGVNPISVMADKENNRIFLRYILPLEKVHFSPEENKPRFHAAIGRMLQAELGKVLEKRDGRAIAALADELKKLEFACPEYDAARYYLALADGKDELATAEAFTTLKDSFKTLPENLRRLVIETAEKYERTGDLEELKPKTEQGITE